MIELKNLTIEHKIKKGIFKAVDDLSLKVDESQSLGLVGESGSGKSSILKAIMGLDVITSPSQINIGNFKLTNNKRSKDFYRLIGMVFQDPYASLHPRHTIDRALNEPLIIHKIKDKEAKIKKVLDDVSLSTSFRFRYPHELSGGQRQRVAIARVLLLNPKIILLDEVTSALDVSVQAEVLNLLNDLRIEHNLTYIFVSHDLSVVSFMCNEVGVIKSGKLIEIAKVGKNGDLMVKDSYSKELAAASLF